MSKISRLFLVTLTVINLILSAEAQDFESTITVDAKTPNIVHFSGKIYHEVDRSIFWNFGFLAMFPRARGLGERFLNIKAADATGRELALRQMQPGIFNAEGAPNSWSYDADLTPLTAPIAAAHLSFINGDYGILMSDDILPRDKGNAARLKIELPPGWVVLSTEPEILPGVFDVRDLLNAVFLIGKNWRVTEASTKGISCRVATIGELPFSEAEAARFAGEILSHYANVFGTPPRNKAQITLMPFATGIPAGNWEAGSRGTNITIVTAGTAFNSQSLQQLHEQLRHEIFHLWMPNGLRLNGSYDWFYEGFALYQSLKFGVAVNRIRFDDYLDTLSRAYDLDRRLGGKSSLIDASNNRWSGDNNTVIYARGMLVAFLCDLALLEASKGKRSSDDVVREFYSGSTLAEDGNVAAIRVLKSHKELVPIVNNYVSGVSAVDWARLLQAAGLQAETNSGVTTLTVLTKPTGSQKRLLDKLGYNNWRKLSSK